MKNYLFKSSFVCMLLLFATVAFGRTNDLMHNIANSDVEKYQESKPIDFCNVAVTSTMFHRVIETGTEQIAVITYSFTTTSSEITITSPVREILSVFSDYGNVEYLKRVKYAKGVESDKIYKRPLRITV